MAKISGKVILTLKKQIGSNLGCSTDFTLES